MTHGQQEFPPLSAPQPQIAPAAPYGLSGPNVDCAIWLDKSRQAIKAQNFSSAIEAAQSARDVCPDPKQALLYQADAQMLSKQFEPTEETLRTILAADPQDEAALQLLAQVQYLNNHDAEAEGSFLRAIAAAPEDPEPHYMLGRLYYEDSRYKEAVAQFQLAIQINGKFYKAYDNLGLCEEALGDKASALKDYLKALEMVYKDHPEYDTVYSDLAEFMLKQGDSQRAFNLAAEAASRNPRSPRAFYLAGKALMESNHDVASLRWLKRAAQIDPAYPEPHYLMARIYKKQGNNGEANAEANVFKTLNENAPKVKR